MPATNNLDQLANQMGIKPLNPATVQNLDDLARNAGIKPVQPTEEDDQRQGGFWTSLAKGVARPFATTAATGLSAIKGAAELGGAGVAKLIGDETTQKYLQEQARKTVSEGVNIPGYGKIKPVGADITSPERYKEEAERMIGTGLEAGSWFTGGGEVAPIVQELRAGKVLQPIAAAAKEAGVLGAVGSAGAAMGEKKPAGEVAESALAGGLLGTTLGVAGPSAGALVRGAKEAVFPGFEKLVVSAVKPTGKTARTFTTSLNTAMEDLAEYAPQIKDLRSFATAGKTKLADLWQQIQDKVYQGSKEKMSIDGNDVVNAMVNSVKGNSKLIRENPDLANKLIERAQAYSGNINPVEVEELLERSNAELESFFRKTGSERSLAEKADPEMAMEIAKNNALRELLNQKLSSIPSEFQNLKNRYGALREVVNQLEKRIPVAERANIVSLAEQLSAARSTGNALIKIVSGRPLEGIASLGEAVMARGLKKLEEPDAKIERAFQQLLKQGSKK